jgi:biotin carboxyl carrier protein
MKMQNEIKSPKDGRVVEIRVAPGDTVAVGDILAIIE